jgi:transcriptional/translational regulatory protein YebC/TACO1
MVHDNTLNVVSYGKMVTMCVKAGGADPVSNVQLAKLLEQAKQVFVGSLVVFYSPCSYAG